MLFPRTQFRLMEGSSSALEPKAKRARCDTEEVEVVSSQIFSIPELVCDILHVCDGRYSEQTEVNLSVPHKTSRTELLVDFVVSPVNSTISL